MNGALPLAATEPTRRRTVLESLRLATILTASVVLLVGRGPTWRTLVALLAVYLFVVLTAKLQYRPVRYSMTSTLMTREARGATVEVPIASITQVKWSSTWKRGDQVTILGADEPLIVDITKGTEPLLKALGPLLASAGRDRVVIADGITRHWVGLPEVGTQAPETGPAERQTRPSVGGNQG